MSLLTGQRAVVTGAGSGIGRQAALVCAREGARVGVLDVDARAEERTIADDNAQENIRVNGVVPGHTRTPMPDWVTSEEHEARRARCGPPTAG
jgi:NAD(P)-dependent dehydrogenase (short-subunit alcohol dehydrogenase family)